jgi:hypothetical protein
MGPDREWEILMAALRSTLAELRASAADGSTAALLTEECVTLLEHLDRLHVAVLAADQGFGDAHALIHPAATEIRELEKP